MYNDLKTALIEYSNFTIHILEELQAERYDELAPLINKRWEIIEFINNIDYSKDEFTKISKKLKLLEYEDTVNELFNLKRNNLRIELDKLVKSKTANRSYNKSFNVDALYFNKKI